MTRFLQHKSRPGFESGLPTDTFCIRQIIFVLSCKKKKHRILGQGKNHKAPKQNRKKETETKKKNVINEIKLNTSKSIQINIINDSYQWYSLQIL